MFKNVKTYANMVKFSHTIFAMPFALASVILAFHQNNLYQNQIQFKWFDLIWILFAMVGARSAAMGFNRLTDAAFDKKNPRTTNREIPSGKISISSTVIFVIFFSGLFIFSAAMINKLCLYLSIPVLLVLFFYSFTKRFTWLSHIYLGFSISLAPIGAWIAITNGFSWSILLLSLALLTHIAGFDVLYACQDLDFDKKQGLYSIPVKFGVKKALDISSLIHLLSFAFFVFIFIVFNMGYIYLLSVFIIGGLFIWEHKLVNPNDLSQVDVAFFNINSIISVVLFLGILGDELTRWWLL